MKIGTDSNATKPNICRHLSEVDKKRAVAIGTVITGIIAKEMGYTNQSQVCQAGREVFRFVSSLTYRQFSNIKRLNNVGSHPTTQIKDKHESKEG